jgi:hypothetical protein
MYVATIVDGDLLNELNDHFGQSSKFEGTWLSEVTSRQLGW